MVKRPTASATLLSDESHDSDSDLPELAGNALLISFLRICIVELFRRHWSSTGQGLPTASHVIAVERAHLRILQAIGDGDDSLAHYPIRRIWTLPPVLVAQE